VDFTVDPPQRSHHALARYLAGRNDRAIRKRNEASSSPLILSLSPSLATVRLSSQRFAATLKPMRASAPVGVADGRSQVLNRVRCRREMAADRADLRLQSSNREDTDGSPVAGCWMSTEA